MDSPLNFRVNENCYRDVGNTVNSYWQSAWLLGDKLPVDFNATEPGQQSVDDHFRATFPLSHL